VFITPSIKDKEKREEASNKRVRNSPLMVCPPSPNSKGKRLDPNVSPFPKFKRQEIRSKWLEVLRGGEYKKLDPHLLWWSHPTHNPHAKPLPP
jgi:hypothetical protein